MPKYAIINNGIVENVIEYDQQPTNPPPSFSEGYIAIQSDIAAPGFTYENGVFTAPQPFPSWTLINNVWSAPIPYPLDDKVHSWDETTKSWI
jgi:hypothetical protein